MNNDDKLGCAIIVLLILLTPFIFAGCYAGNHYTYSTGYRDGVVEKFSEKGILFKTCEGRLILSGLEFHGGDGGGVATARVFEFTVADPEVRRRLEQISPGKKVRLHYEAKLTTWSPNGSTPYFITKIEER